MCDIPHHFSGKLTIPLLVLPAIFLFGIGCFVRKRTIMSKKLIYLISFVLVLCLFQTSIANAADPNLIGWWKFDEGSGTIAYDSSGNGNDGTFNGCGDRAGDPHLPWAYERCLFRGVFAGRDADPDGEFG